MRADSLLNRKDTMKTTKSEVVIKKLCNNVIAEILKLDGDLEQIAALLLVRNMLTNVEILIIKNMVQKVNK